MFCSVVLLVTLFAPMAPQGETEAVIDPQERVEQAIRSYRELLADRDQTTEVQAALEGLQKLYAVSLEAEADFRVRLARKEGQATEWKRAIRDGERDRKDLADAVYRAFRERRRVNPANQGIWRKAVWALARMPEHGASWLWRVYEDKRFDKDSQFLAAVVDGVGRTKDYRQYEKLLDLLQHHDYTVLAAAAGAFRYYKEAPGSIRRECTKELVKRMESYRNAANDRDGYGSGERWSKARGPMMRSLTALTGESFSDTLAWTRYWNKNKNRRELWRDR